MKKFLYTVAVICLAITITACSSPSSPTSAPDNAQYGIRPPSGAAASTQAPSAPYYPGDGYYSSESYLVIDENRRESVAEESMLTFSLKVDTAAYSNVARYIASGNLPPVDAVRTEELINYFTYEERMVFGRSNPFALSAQLAPSPFGGERYMAYIRVKSQDIDKSELPPCNLTFLIDTSGSMNSYDKLPLLKDAFELLVDTLDEDDRVSIVTYAGSAGIVLDSVSGDDKRGIMRAIDKLEASGSTAGAEGILTAYKLAEKNYIEGGNNRVILATDGDFNVGLSTTDQLAEMVAEKRGNGVYLSILGFGTGNIRDDIMETLSKEGNGNYSYIYDLAGAEKVLVEELASNLYVIAEDVKAQVEFNPENVKSYRLIGYENRALDNEDFTDDTKDAGEIGAGCDVVMMFELELYEEAEAAYKKYTTPLPSQADYSNELFEVRLRYKDSGKTASKLMTLPVYYDDITASPGNDFTFACSVAAFGELLRGSRYSGNATIFDILALAEDSLGEDAEGYRREFITLLEQYRRIAR